MHEYFCFHSTGSRWLLLPWKLKKRNLSDILSFLMQTLWNLTRMLFRVCRKVLRFWSCQNGCCYYGNKEIELKKHKYADFTTTIDWLSWNFTRLSCRMSIEMQKGLEVLANGCSFHGNQKIRVKTQIYWFHYTNLWGRIVLGRLPFSVLAWIFQNGCCCHGNQKN